MKDAMVKNTLQMVKNTLKLEWVFSIDPSNLLGWQHVTRTIYHKNNSAT